MMLAFLERAVDADDYLVFSLKIMAAIPDHLARGEIDLVHGILSTFKDHAHEKPPAIAEMADNSLLAFSRPDIASAAVSALDTCPEDKRDLLLSLLAEFGQSCIPDLIRAYADQEYPSPKEHLLELLVSFGESTLEEVYRQFHYASERILRNLLLLVQHIGKVDSATAVRQLLSHPNREVSRDALITLLEFKDPEAPHYLRRAILSIDPDDSMRAIGLAGYYRVTETAEDLVRLIKTNLIRKAALRANDEILRALGRIGDLGVLPSLERIAGKSWSFSPRRLRHLKHTLFESLGGYPRHGIEGLLEIGRRSGDLRIERICDRLDS
jgi:hypothetical protein